MPHSARAPTPCLRPRPRWAPNFPACAPICTRVGTCVRGAFKTATGRPGSLRSPRSLGQLPFQDDLSQIGRQEEERAARSARDNPNGLSEPAGSPSRQCTECQGAHPGRVRPQPDDVLDGVLAPARGPPEQSRSKERSSRRRHRPSAPDRTRALGNLAEAPPTSRAPVPEEPNLFGLLESLAGQLGPGWKAQVALSEVTICWRPGGSAVSGFSTEGYRAEVSRLRE